MCLVGCGESGVQPSQNAQQPVVKPANVKLQPELTSLETVELKHGVLCCIKIKNPNKEYMIELPHVNIVYLNDDNQMVDYDENTLFNIAPDDEITIIEESYSESEFTHIEVELETKEDYIRKPSEYSTAVNTSDFIFENVLIDGNRIVGELFNNSDVEQSMVRCSLVLRKEGKFVGGEFFFVDDVPAHGSAKFASNFVLKEYDSYELYGFNW